MDQNQNIRRVKLHDLVHDHFAGDIDIVVDVIEKSTPGAKVSVRSVQAWLMDPDRPSSRNCPPWAINALEEYVANPVNRSRLDVLKKRQARGIGKLSTPSDWSNEVRTQRSVHLATSQIEGGARALREWQELLGKQPGQRIYELEQQLQSDQRALSEWIAAIHHGLCSSSTFDEFKASYIELDKANDRVRQVIRDTRRSIEKGLNEFGSEDAVIGRPSEDKQPG